jgi:hypothetical protein
MKRLLLAAVLFLPLLSFAQGTAIATGDWTLVSSPGGWASQNNGYGKLQYIANQKLHCWFEFYKQTVTTEVNQALGCWSLPENRWHLFQAHGGWQDAHQVAPGHTVSQMTYDSTLGVMMVQADGAGSQQPYEVFPGDWEWYDFAGVSGRIKTFSPRPWLMEGNTPLYAAAVYHANTQRMIMWSQQNYSTSGTNDVYSCDDAANVCTKITLTGALPVVNGTPSVRLNTTNNKIYYYGGGQAGIYTLTCTNATCTTATVAHLTPTCTGADCTATAPPVRSYVGMDYSPVDGLFLMASGSTAVCGGLFTDTWKFDPVANSGNGAWTELAPAHNYSNAGCTSFDRLSYDADSNAFVMINNANQVYLYAFSTALNYGRTSPSYAPTAGYLNHGTTSSSAQSYGYGPSLMAIGSTIYASHIEAGPHADNSTNCMALFHPYVQSLSGTSWTNLPTYSTTSCLGLDPEGGTAGATISSNTLLANVNGTAWEMHVNSTSALAPQARARSWNGSAWSGGATGCFTATCDGTIAQKPQAFIGIGTKPTAAIVESVRDAFVADNYMYVVQQSAGVWAKLGGAWNRNASSQAEEASIASDGTNPGACWSEMVKSTRDANTLTPQVYCSRWNGSSVVTMGGSLNTVAGTASDWATYPQVVYIGATWYAIWTQRSVGGQQNVYAASFNGTTWSLLGGGSINVNTSTGWAAHPSCATDGTDLYCAWEEQDSLGAISKGYLKKWSVAGAAWSQIGGAFNADTTNGSVADTRLIYANGRPTMAWSEMKYGNLSQVYSKQWNGQAFVADGSPTPDTCALTSPASGNVISRFFNLVATATAGGGSMNSLQLTLDGNPLGSDLGGAGSFIWDTQTIANGTHTLAGTCGDTVGGTGIIASVTVTVNNHPGLGASTPTCVDHDGDGYGTGPGCTNPTTDRDADDFDATVHTAGQGASKWGSVAAFLTHLGYNPLRYRVISPTGNDTTCTVHNLITDPDPTAVTACATYAHVQGLIVPGDITFYRAGTYTERLNIYLAASGTVANPVIYMAYPGEAVTISNSRPVDACNDPSHVDHWVLDGFNLTAPSLGGGDDGVLVCEHNGFTIRNNDIRYTTRGIFGAQDMNDGLIEFNIVHDTNGVSGTHTLYLGARDLPNARLTIANNIFYNPGLTCMQHNGRVGNLTLDGNMCYGVTNASGISLEMGAHDSLIRNNLVFNTDVKPFVIFDYPEQSCVGSGSIIPYDQKNNVIENNTFVVGAKKNDGSGIGTTPNILISASLPVGSTQDLGHNTFRNNLLINHSGGVPLAVTTSSWNCSCYDGLDCTGSNYSGNGSIDPNTIAATLTWANNDVWSLSSPSSYAMSLSNVQGVQGTVPGGNPSSVTSNLGFSAWQAYNGTTTGNLNSDPLFTAYDDLWFATPANYNFRPGAGSPAVHGGTSTGVPLTDIGGATFASPPAIGAFERLAAILLNGWTIKGFTLQP